MAPAFFAAVPTYHVCLEMDKSFLSASLLNKITGISWFAVSFRTLAGEDGVTRCTYIEADVPAGWHFLLHQRFRKELFCQKKKNGQFCFGVWLHSRL